MKRVVIDFGLVWVGLFSLMLILTPLFLGVYLCHLNLIFGLLFLFLFTFPLTQFLAFKVKEYWLKIRIFIEENFSE